MSFVLYNFYAITANGLFYPRAAPVLFSLFSRRFFLDFAFFFWTFRFFHFTFEFRHAHGSRALTTFVRERAGVHRYSGYRRVDCIVKLELYSAETPAGSFRSALGPAFRTFRPNLLPSAVGEPLDPSRRSRKAACTLVGGTERLLGLDLGLGL